MMKRKPNNLVHTASALALVGGLAMIPGLQNTAVAASAENVAAGKDIAYSRTKGNCLACHAMDDGASPGTIGPPLVSMKARFPDRAKLKEQIYDSTLRNPLTMMPPFGKYEILSDKEIELVVDYIWTL